MTQNRSAETADVDAILQELEDVCSDPAFQSSQRNCEFLRFVVSESLNGRGDELRERTLGVELFGRSGTYDTSTDAIVRVRANDVRKRLIRHYEQFSSRTGWQIALPPRSYQVVFARNMRQEREIGVAEGRILPDPRRLSWRQLLTPSLFAFAICASTLRWQVLASNPFMTFWSTLLVGKSSMNVVIDSSADSIRINQLRALGPLLSVANLFKVDVHFFVTPESAAAQDPNALMIHFSPLAASSGSGVRVEPGQLSVLWFQGQGQAEVDQEIKDLTDADRFPAEAAQNVQRNKEFFIPIDRNIQLAGAPGAPPSGSERQ